MKIAHSATLNGVKNWSYTVKILEKYCFADVFLSQMILIYMHSWHTSDKEFWIVLNKIGKQILK